MIDIVVLILYLAGRQDSGDETNCALVEEWSRVSRFLASLNTSLSCRHEVYNLD